MGGLKLSPTEREKQERYRDARFKDEYDKIWQSVAKCVFCDLNEKYIFFEENGIVMTIQLFAYIDGHFMIVPRRHVKSTKELNQTEWETVRKFTYMAKKLIKSVHGIGGMQLVQKDGTQAQSTVEHLHFHCIPFDSPDLCTWNYRQLEYTPLENVTLYKKARKKIIEHDKKFDRKYRNHTSLPIVCDALIINEKRELLLQERCEADKFVPDILTLPGGHVDDTARSLEEELARELAEEVGHDFKAGKFRLLDSRISSLKHKKRIDHLNARYTGENTFLWNTYVVEDFDSATPLEAGDDCESLIWLPLDEVSGHPRVSDGVKRTVDKL